MTGIKAADGCVAAMSLLPRAGTFARAFNSSLQQSP